MCSDASLSSLCNLCPVARRTNINQIILFWVGVALLRLEVKHRDHGDAEHTEQIQNPIPNSAIPNPTCAVPNLNLH